MKLMEYQGKELFAAGRHPGAAQFVRDHRRRGARVHRRELRLVGVKSQVMMGGRGKAGGIKFADAAAEGEKIASELIGKTLQSVQNPAGEKCASLLVEEKLPIESEAYVSITLDRATKKPVIIVSAKGGMDVEEVAEHDPDALVKHYVDVPIGFQPFIARELAFNAKLPAGYLKTFPKIVEGLYRLFFEYGANLVEINPLVLTKTGEVYASDAKVDLDDNALFRHPELKEWSSDEAAEGDEAVALATGLGRNNYGKLPGDGAVGTIANGAGLAMGTMDAIRNAGGQAANFLDIGGGAKADLVRKSYELVVSNPNVKALFINIFGGITRGDQVASGIVEALKGEGLRKVPMVVRLTGTNEEEGRRILTEAGITAVETMDEGAAKAVALANG